MKTSIRKRMSLFWIAGMLVLIVVFSFIFFSYFNRIYKERMEQDQWNYTSGTADSVSVLMMNIRQNAYYLCCSEDLASALIDPTGRVSAQQLTHLNSIFSLSTGTPTAPLMQSAYPVLLLDRQFPLASQAKAFTLSRSLTRQHIYSSLGSESEAWYAETVALRGQILVFRDGRMPDYVFFSHQLRSTRIADPRYNDTIGVVLYAMPAVRLNALLDAGRLNDETCVVLLYDGAVMACTDPALFPLGQPAPEDLPSPREGSHPASFTLAGTRWAVTRTRFQGGWECAVLVPEQSIVSRDAPLYLLAALLLLPVAMILAVSLVLSRQVIRPITRLSGVMEQARDAEHMPLAAEPRRQDEIAVLYQRYNAMAVRIQALSVETKAEQEKALQSELKMRQAQINPHFIYNTLDSISCSALMEGNDDIVTMVASLISILKYSVNFSRATVPLREEINYLEDYICIQKIRYSDGFSFSCEIPEQYMSVAVFPVTLQPLVENALFHAKSDRLQIRLYCEEENGMLLLHVTDNGSASDADRINALLQGNEETDSHSIGVRNVYRRVTLLSDGRGDLRYQNLRGGGLDAVIRIPLVYTESDSSPA